LTQYSRSATASKSDQQKFFSVDCLTIQGELKPGATYVVDYDKVLHELEEVKQQK